MIILVLAVIGALTYFGVFKPQSAFPDICNFQIGFHCSDYQVSSEGYPVKIDGNVVTVQTPENSIFSVTFDAENNLGSDVYITNISITGDGIQCANIQYDDCSRGSSGNSFVEYYEAGLNQNPPTLEIDPEKNCISVKEMCKVKISGNSICGPVTPEQIILWKNGAKLRAGLDLLNADYLTIPCYSVPEKGNRADGEIMIEYSKSDPSKGELTHTAVGEIHATVI